MSSRYEGPSAMDREMIGVIDVLVSDAMDEARAMTQDEWDERDEGFLPHYFASAIFYAVKNRLREAP